MTAYRITGPYFVAGVVVDDGGIVQSAPILGRWRGQRWYKLKAYAEAQGWPIEARPRSGISHDPNKFHLPEIHQPKRQTVW